MKQWILIAAVVAGCNASEPGAPSKASGTGKYQTVVKGEAYDLQALMVPGAATIVTFGAPW